MIRRCHDTSIRIIRRERRKERNKQTNKQTNNQPTNQPTNQPEKGINIAKLLSALAWKYVPNLNIIDIIPLYYRFRLKQTRHHQI